MPGCSRVTTRSPTITTAARACSSVASSTAPTRQCPRARSTSRECSTSSAPTWSFSTWQSTSCTHSVERGACRSSPQTDVRYIAQLPGRTREPPRLRSPGKLSPAVPPPEALPTPPARSQGPPGPGQIPQRGPDGTSPSRARSAGPSLISNTIAAGGFSPNTSRIARSASNRGQREQRGKTP